MLNPCLSTSYLLAWLVTLRRVSEANDDGLCVAAKLWVNTVSTRAVSSGKNILIPVRVCVWWCICTGCPQIRNTIISYIQLTSLVIICHITKLYNMLIPLYWNLANEHPTLMKKRVFNKKIKNPRNWIFKHIFP